MKYLPKCIYVTLVIWTLAGVSFAGTAQDIYAKHNRSVVDVLAINSFGNIKSSGSGFIAGSGRLVVTCAHVVNGAEKLVVSLSGKSQCKASLEVIDNAADVAVLSIQGTSGQPLQFTKSTVVPGLDVFTIGSPLGLGDSIATGIVSAVRKLPGGLCLIQTTAPTSPGSSGCPLLNTKGQVIGMMSLASSGRAQNVNFAIAYSVIKPYVSKALQQLTTAVKRARDEKSENLYFAYKAAIQKFDSLLNSDEADESTSVLLENCRRMNMDPRLAMAVALSSSTPCRLNRAFIESSTRRLRLVLGEVRCPYRWNDIEWQDIQKALIVYRKRYVSRSSYTVLTKEMTSFEQKVITNYKELCGIDEKAGK